MIICGRLAVTEEIQNQFHILFDIFDVNERGKITAE